MTPNRFRWGRGLWAVSTLVLCFCTHTEPAIAASTSLNVVVIQTIFKKYSQGIPYLSLSVATPIIQAIRHNTESGVGTVSGVDMACSTFEEFKVAPQGLFGFRFSSPSDHRRGGTAIPQNDWMRWAIKHDFLTEMLLSYRLHSSDPAAKPVFLNQFCRQLKDVSQSGLSTQIADLMMTAQQINQFQLNTAEFGMVPAYYVRFTLEWEPEYPDIDIEPKQLTGYARVFIRPDTGEGQLVDDGIDQFADDAFKISITYKP